MEKGRKLLATRQTLANELQNIASRIETFVENSDRVSKVDKSLERADDVMSKLVDRTTELAGLTDGPPDAGTACDWLSDFRQKVDPALNRAREYIRDRKADCRKSLSSARGSAHESGSRGSVTSSQRAAKLHLQKELLAKELERQEKAQEEIEDARLRQMQSTLQIERLRRNEEGKRKLHALEVQELLGVLEDTSSVGGSVASEAKSNLGILQVATSGVETWVDKIQVSEQADSAQSQAQNLASFSVISPPVTTAVSRHVGFAMNGSLSNAAQSAAPTSQVASAPLDLATSQSIPNFVPTASAASTNVVWSAAAGPTTSQGPQIASEVRLPRQERFDKLLPKWKLSTFSGDPLEWPEWRGMFLNTVARASISNDEKMNHLKTLLSGKAKSTIAGFAFCGEMFDQAWAALERRFGRPHIIVGAQLDKLSRHPNVRMHNSESLIEYSIAVSSFVNVLSQMGYQNDLQSSSNLQLVVAKLPPNLKEKWFEYLSLQANDFPNLWAFDNWLQLVAETHERMLSSGKPTAVCAASENKQSKTRNDKPSSFVADTSKTKFPCLVCKENHQLWRCPSFKKKTPTERAEFAKDKKLCFSCLQGDCSFRNCQRSRKCGIDGCTRTHNSLIHGAERVHPRREQQGAGEQPVPSQSLEANAAPRGALLQVLKVKVSSGGNELETLALCDSGSTHSWASPEVKTKLKLSGERQQMSVDTFGGCNEIDTCRAKLRVSSMDGSESLELDTFFKEDFSVGRNVIDLTRLKKDFPHLKPVPHGIIKFENVHLLLGQDAFPIIRPVEYRSGGANQPWAVRLPLGWVASGPIPKLLRENAFGISSNFSAERDKDEGLNEQVKRWWDMESYASSVNVEPKSLEDKQSLEILEKSTFHDGDRYVVGMLWKDDSVFLPNNFFVAQSQLTTLQKRLSKDENLRSLYAGTIAVDVEKGYVRKVSKSENQRETTLQKQWYLPHHPVLNPNKPGKVRRVCNAASTFRGVSLNNSLLTGPDLLNSLVGILLRFRQYPVALAADIEAMFLQVGVTDQDQRALRFLWREGPSSDVEVYQYTRHVFGAKDSPTCASYALQRTARDNATEFPEASKVVLKDFYMDDLLKSVPCKGEARQLCKALQALLLKGGFKLTKWLSNSPEVVEGLDGVVKESELHVLGIKWTLSNDSLVVSRGTTKAPTGRATQREILSAVSSVFDPLGLIAPFTIRSRLLLKSIWQTKGQQWDEPVESEHQTEFEAWAKDLQQIKEIAIPRLYFPKEPQAIEMHVFADASQNAMCAVVYFRATGAGHAVQISFVIGKARVAPIRAQTIPKLELQAAVVACRLSSSVQTEGEFSIERVIYWSDSSTVLQWIKSSHKKQPVFVANRVAEILEYTTVDQWRHVPGEMNPADCGTRGFSPAELRASAWLNGPAYLRKPEASWPILPALETHEESVSLISVSPETPVNWHRFGNFTKLVRVVARILRLPNRTREARGTVLTADELTKAKRRLWLASQMECFPKEIRDIKADAQCSPKSPLAPLSPFVGPDGLLRAKGRLRKAETLSFGQKHPVVLSSSSHIVKLFLLHIHSSYRHEGVEYLRSIVQQEFWVLRLRSSLRAIKQSCVSCQKLSASPLLPEMADLPVERLDIQSFPFSSVGVDYFGPVEVRFARKTLKRWCFLFTCMTTRA